MKTAKDELVARIAATVVGQAEAASIAQARRKRLEDMSAYDCLLRGLELHRLGGVTRDNPAEAVKWFDRAIELDPAMRERITTGDTPSVSWGTTGGPLRITMKLSS